MTNDELANGLDDFEAAARVMPPTIEDVEREARRVEARARREHTLATLDEIMLLADKLPEDLIGTQSLLVKYQIIGACLSALSQLRGRRNGPVIPTENEQ
jgi:hypothetical protein